MAGAIEASPEQLADLLRTRKDELVDAWCRRVAADPGVPEAQRLERPALRDDVPRFLDVIIESLARLPARDGGIVEEARADAMHAHAESRARARYSVAAALREWSHLRAAMVALTASHGLTMAGRAGWFVHAEIDDAMTRVAVELHARDRADVEAQREAALLRAAELEAVLASLPEAVLIGDGGGVRLANKRALEYLGAAPGETLADAIAAMASRVEVLEPDTREPVAIDQIGWKEAAAGTRVELELIIRYRATGVERGIRCSMAPVLSAAGTILGVVALASDVTERRRSEQRLAEEAELRDRFAAILGHDLRTPLTSILGTASTMLSRFPAPSPEARSLRRIVEASVRMSRMIGQVLDFARVRFGELPIEVGPCDLAEVCRAIVDEMHAIDPQRPFEIVVEGDTTGAWDRDRLAQVVANLLGNAHEHARRDTPIVVHVSGSGDVVHLSVANVGDPIPPDRLGEIFEPFRAGPERRARGLGLGLYIVRRIVEAHGGRVSAASDAEGQTVFTMTLPRSTSA